MTDLPDLLAQGVAAMRASRWSDAVALLSIVADDEAVASDPDLADIHARTQSLYAQALMEAGHPEEAEPRLRAALRILRRLGDPAGIAEVRALQDRVVSALAHVRETAQRAEEQARIAATPLEELLAEATTPGDRAGVLVKKAVAALETGSPDEAASLATQALLPAEGHATWTVHALLVRARAVPDGAAEDTLAAYGVAERAAEFNLVSLVATTATSIGVALPSLPGPHLGRTPEDP